jgi:hypothetical protein
MNVRRTVHLLLALLVVVGLGSIRAVADTAPSAKQPRLEDFIAEPGTSQKFQPFMLHADYWLGLDQRVKLDTIVFALENGARCAQVMNLDSTWAVDYTWLYPHSLFPPRWYDAKSLLHTGDSLKLPDDAGMKFTFGTMRIGVHAGSLGQATSEAYRHWPTVMPPALQGRLKLKLERARKALAGKSDTEPADSLMK